MSGKVKGWHLSGNNHKPHFFDPKTFPTESTFKSKYALSVCKKVSAYSGISVNSCDEIYKTKEEYLARACNYCLTLVVQQKRKRK